MESQQRYRPYIVTSLVWIIILGLYVLYDRWPRPETIVIETPAPTSLPTAGQIVVQIVGAVKSPGVYHLATGARVEQAVQAAGGLLDEASETFNQAALLSDGQLIYVPLQDETPPPEASATSRPVESSPTDNGKININTASAEQLETLPGIGPALASRIIAYREAHGPFASLEEIDLVEGIGPACIQKIKDLVVVE